MEARTGAWAASKKQTATSQTVARGGAGSWASSLLLSGPRRPVTNIIPRSPVQFHLYGAAAASATGANGSGATGGARGDVGAGLRDCTSGGGMGSGRASREDNSSGDSVGGHPACRGREGPPGISDSGSTPRAPVSPASSMNAGGSVVRTRSGDCSGRAGPSTGGS